MIRTCARCGRGYVEAGPERVREPPRWTPPTLCPGCRRGAKPLSKLYDGRPEPPPPADEA